MMWHTCPRVNPTQAITKQTAVQMARRCRLDEFLTERVGVDLFLHLVLPFSAAPSLCDLAATGRIWRYRLAAPTIWQRYLAFGVTVPPPQRHLRIFVSGPDTASTASTADTADTGAAAETVNITSAAIDDVDLLDQAPPIASESLCAMDDRRLIWAKCTNAFDNKQAAFATGGLENASVAHCVETVSFVQQRSEVSNVVEWIICLWLL